LPSPVATTGPNGALSFTAPNVHYLLVIGSNSTSDAMRPTIHDNITLTGGNQTLHAPNLVASTYGSNVPFTPAPAEVSGNYRLTTLDPTQEVPCLQAFDSQRARA
jgi:hypothetical protein